MTEIPSWNKKDTLLSLKDIAIIGFGALKECLVDAADWARDWPSAKDTHYANRINSKEDES